MLIFSKIKNIHDLLLKCDRYNDAHQVLDEMLQLDSGHKCDRNLVLVAIDDLQVHHLVHFLFTY